MLEELRIQNFAIIDHLELSFGNGFNVITGETGAGKSIIIDAVELLLGGKADPDFVRAGAEKLVVEGVFALSHHMQGIIDSLLAVHDLEGESPGFVTMAREVRVNGRSTARVNGITVNLETFREIGELLVDVHGQSEHLSLLRPRSHIDLLDRFADMLDPREALASVVGHVNQVRKDIRFLLDDKAKLQRRADQLRYEIEEIDAADLKPGEDDDLLSEATRLSNSEQLATLVGEVTGLLYGSETADEQLPVLDGLMRSSTLMHKLASVDSDLKPEADLAEGLAAQLEELVRTLRRYADTVEYNPDRLDEVQERLEMINRLKRRFGATIDDILAFAEKARVELDNIDNSEERLVELRAEEEKLLRSIGDLAHKISSTRIAAGIRLGEGIVTELKDLRMERARFEVSCIQHDDPEGCYVGDRRLAFDETGIDQIEFMMAANPGEPMKPLAKVASGGETARIMLALKRVLTAADRTPTLIFDEIDQGIGGRVGSVVGEKLWSLSDNHQVLVVTHLAQLAGYADRHYHVAKGLQVDRTTTRVTLLEEEEVRVHELAEMLGAQGESGKLSALDILRTARERKSALIAAQGGSLPGASS